MKTNNCDENRKTSNGSRNNRSKGYNSRRPNNSRKPKDKYVKPEGKESSPGDINNPAYYYEDPNVLSQVMNFSFNQFNGVNVDVMMDLSTRVDYYNSSVMSIALHPSVPVTAAASGVISGTTTAALRNFLMLSGSNAKSTNYAPQDVVILELALAEVIKMSTFCARAIGIAYLFNYRNRTYPESLLQAMGIDSADFKSNLARYRIKFNTLMTLASKIPFPNTISCFSKAADLFGSLYLDDEDSAMAQTYLFVPATTWLFDEAYDTNGSGLRTTTVVFPNTIQTLDYYLSILEAMISALLNSTTLNYIYSDIMRLVQNGKVTSLITFTSIPENFNVIPVYNKEVETWLHNAIILGDPLPTTGQYNPFARPYTPKNDVSSDASSNTIKYWPQFTLDCEHCGYEAFIDFDHDNITVEEKVRATRFSQRWYNITDSGSGITYTDEIALNDCYIAYVELSDGVNTPSWYNRTIIKYDASAYASHLKYIDEMSKYDWHPLLYFYDDMQVMRIVGDLDYYTLVDYSTLHNIYDYEIINFLQIK